MLNNDLIENKNINEFYKKYQIKYINQKNLFPNFDKITYFSSFISYPHYFKNLYNDKYFEIIKEMFYNKKILIVTHYENFLKNKILELSENNESLLIDKNFFEDLDNILEKINMIVKNKNINLCLLMVEKFSPLISSKISEYVKVIDLGKLFGVYNIFLKNKNLVSN